MRPRGGLKVEYMHFAEHGGTTVLFMFQFDGSQRGLFDLDFWGRISESR